MINSPFFSIIIPVFNTEFYLRDCIKSVLEQDSKDFEIILIDDCSTDASAKICRDYKYVEKFKVFKNQKTIGAGLSRNKGMILAKGKYIIFLDSDDLLKKNCLKGLSKFIIQNKNKNIYITQYTTNKPPYSNSFFINQNFINKKELILKLNKNEYQTNVCWHYIFEKIFLVKNKIKFKDLKIYEDQDFITQVLLKIDSFSVYKKDYYWHRIRKGSLTQAINLETTKSIIKLIVVICKLIKNNKPTNYMKIFLRRQLKNAMEQFAFRLVLHQYKSEVLKINNYAKKYFNKNKSYLNNFFNIKLKYESYKEFSNLRNHIINSMLKDLDLIKKEKIYIYCAHVYGIALSQELKRKNFNIECILDDNSKTLFNLENKHKIKIKLPKNILKKISIQKSEYKILVCARTNITYQNILKKLVSLNISKKNVINRSAPFG